MPEKTRCSFTASPDLLGILQGHALKEERSFASTVRRLTIDGLVHRGVISKDEAKVLLTDGRSTRGGQDA